MKDKQLIGVGVVSIIIGIGTWMILPNSDWADNHQTASTVIKVIATAIGLFGLYWIGKLLKNQ